MARFILTCLAALALAVAPASVTASRANCARAMAQPMAAMDPSTPRRGDNVKASKSPCCHGDSKTCAKACAAMCAVGALAPAGFDGVVVFGTRASSDPATSLFSPSREPTGFDPPPKPSLI